MEVFQHLLEDGSELQCEQIYELESKKIPQKLKNKYAWTNYILIIEQLRTMKSKSNLIVDAEESQFKLEQNSKKKRTGDQNKNYRYSVINYEKRVELINLASSKGYSISRAARELGIKPSTGKFIVKCFRDYGKIMKKSCSQTPKSAASVSDQDNSETRGPKAEKEERSSNFSSHQENNSSEKEINTGSAHTVSSEVDAPLYFFAYPYEQPSMTQFIFYPSYENFQGVTLPLFVQQGSQY